MWFDAKAALKEIRAAKSQTLQQQDCSQNAEPISGISGISSLGLSHCKNSHLRENGEKQLYQRPLHNRRFTPLLGFGMFALVNLRRFYGPIFA